MNKMLKVQKAGMSSFQDKVDLMGNDLKLTASDLDKLEQYGRRNNLEIHGIPYQKDKDTNQIVKKVASMLKVKLENSEISTSHRLFDANNLSRLNINYHHSSNRNPSIIVRFTNRDKKKEMKFTP